MQPDFDTDDVAALANALAAMQHHKKDPWLTPEETADLIGRSSATLKAWRRKRRGPEFFRVGHSGVRYRTSAVEAWRSTSTPC